MGIVNNYIAVSPDVLERTQRDPDFLVALLYSENENDLGLLPSQIGRRIDLDKAWDGLWYLLSEERRVTEDLYEPADLLGRAIDGAVAFNGRLNDYDADPRYLLPNHVHEIAEILGRLDADDLVEHFDPVAMNNAEVYPGDWEAIGVEYILRAFLTLQAFYAAASLVHQAVIVWRS